MSTASSVRDQILLWAPQRVCTALITHSECKRSISRTVGLCSFVVVTFCCCVKQIHSRNLNTLSPESHFGANLNIWRLIVLTSLMYRENSKHFISGVALRRRNNYFECHAVSHSGKGDVFPNGCSDVLEDNIIYGMSRWPLCASWVLTKPVCWLSEEALTSVLIPVVSLCCIFLESMRLSSQGKQQHWYLVQTPNYDSGLRVTDEDLWANYEAAIAWCCSRVSKLSVGVGGWIDQAWDVQNEWPLLLTYLIYFGFLFYR